MEYVNGNLARPSLAVIRDSGISQGPAASTIQWIRISRGAFTGIDPKQTPKRTPKPGGASVPVNSAGNSRFSPTLAQTLKSETSSSAFCFFFFFHTYSIRLYSRNNCFTLSRSRSPPVSPRFEWLYHRSLCSVVSLCIFDYQFMNAALR